ncbi:hypothetical protein RMATCC62417_14837 [Rhizopus microsporus]|nr:hypothetical protein RMATCC62417_14837 [Rhizopus microsporus]
MGKMQKRIEAHSNGREIVKLSFTVFPETETRGLSISPDVVRRVTFFSPVYNVDQRVLATSSSEHNSKVAPPSTTSPFQGPVGAYLFPGQSYSAPVVYVPAPVISSQSILYQSLPTATTNTPSLSESHHSTHPTSSKTSPEQAQPSAVFDQNDSMHGERKYACPYLGCNKAFTRSNHVDRHINSVHTKAEGFECPFCRKQFTREDHFDRHLSTHKKQAKDMKHTIDVEKLRQILRNNHSESQKKESGSVLDSDILRSTSDNTSQVVSNIEKLLQNVMELVKQREKRKEDN